MKSITKFWAGLMTVCLFACLLAPAPAQAQVTPTYVGSITNLPPYLLGSGVTNFTSIIPIRQTRGMALWFSMGATNACATTTWTFWKFSPDGTNWSTTTIPIGTVMNGTTGVISWTNLPPVVTDNSMYMGCVSASNPHTATVWFTNGLFSSRN